MKKSVKIGLAIAGVAVIGFGAYKGLEYQKAKEAEAAHIEAYNEAVKDYDEAVAEYEELVAEAKEDSFANIKVMITDGELYIHSYDASTLAKGLFSNESEEDVQALQMSIPDATEILIESFPHDEQIAQYVEKINRYNELFPMVEVTGSEMKGDSEVMDELSAIGQEISIQYSPDKDECLVIIDVNQIPEPGLEEFL